MTDDPLAPARGIVIGCGISLMFWTVVGVIVRAVTR